MKIYRMTFEVAVRDYAPENPDDLKCEIERKILEHIPCVSGVEAHDYCADVIADINSVDVSAIIDKQIKEGKVAK